MQGLRLRDLRQELEALGIPTAGRVDRESLVELLETEGRRVLLGDTSATPTGPSKKVLQRLDELKTLKARDLKKELNELGLNTEGCVDRESLLELLEGSGLEAIQQAERKPQQEVKPPSQQQEPQQKQQQKGQQKQQEGQQQNPFKDSKPPPVAAEPDAGRAESRIYLLRAVSDHGFKSNARVIAIELEVGCAPLRFVVDTACYHSIIKEKVVSNLFQARFCGQPDWAQEEAPGSGIQQAVISNAFLADGKISCGEVSIASINQELPVPAGCAGILGLDFLTLFDWDFDIEGEKAHIATAPKERRAPLPFDVSGMLPVPLLKIRTPSRNELYACQVKLSVPGQDLEDPDVKFIQAFPDLASSNTLCNKIAAKGMRKTTTATKTKGFGPDMKEKKKKFVDVQAEEMTAVFGIGNSPEGYSVREGTVLAGDVEAFQVLRLTEWPTAILGADLLVRERLVLSFRLNRMWLPATESLDTKAGAAVVDV
eukprot:Skav200064  [mRNA]  locus=scaffold838:72833:74284:+ [translate_table: standard]